MVYDIHSGDTAYNDALTLPVGMISIDTEANKIRVHDGVTQGGNLPAEN